jgi:hypothetical protein
VGGLTLWKIRLQPDAIADGEIGNLRGRQRACAASDFDLEGGPCEIELSRLCTGGSQREQTDQDCGEFG